MSYSELLKDPRWQRKRLEVMERYGFKCCECGSKDKTLHVHHGYYRKNTLPWDYPDRCYRCLCEDCHKEAETLRNLLSSRIGSMPMKAQYFILGWVFGLEHDFGFTRKTVIEEDIPPLVLMGIKNYWEMDDKELPPGSYSKDDLKSMGATVHEED